MHGKAKPAIFTSTPEQNALPLLCLRCNHTLRYDHTVFGGVTPPERWDYYCCRDCNLAFQYRHRTRRLTVSNGKA